jgi:hypothetical protein
LFKLDVIKSNFKFLGYLESWDVSDYMRQFYIE